MVDGSGLIDRAARVAALVEGEIDGLASGARLRGPDDHCGLDRRQPRHRPADRAPSPAHRPGRGRSARPRHHLDDRAWAMIGARDGDEQGLAGHPQAADPPPDRAHRRSTATRSSRSAIPPTARRAAPPSSSEALRPADRPTRWRDREPRSRRQRSPRRSQVSRVIVADTRQRRRSRWRSRCAKFWRRRARRAALDHPRSRDRAPGLGRACALGRRGRGFGRADPRRDRGGRAGPARPRGCARFLARSPSRLFSPILRRGSAAPAPTAIPRARALELGVFRAAPILALDDLDAAFAGARAAAEDRHAHPRRPRSAK